MNEPSGVWSLWALGVLACLPFAVWVFLAIEQLPLASEESVDPKRDMPRGILAGIFTLIVSAFMILWLNPSVAGIESHKLGTSGEPLLDGLTAIYGEGIAKTLALVAVLGLVASFHTIIFAKGRQIYSLSRAGYSPSGLSVTHVSRKTPHIAMIGAMFSYIMQALSYIQLRKKLPGLHRAYRSPFGSTGAMLTVIIATVTLYFQLTDPVYRQGVMWVAIWFSIGIAYFALVGRKRLILSPEEEFALDHAKPVDPETTRQVIA